MHLYHTFSPSKDWYLRYPKQRKIDSSADLVHLIDLGFTDPIHMSQSIWGETYFRES